ncbi:hypothetical protein BV25DRAFT_1842784 [Artomyces pyxidatus]|uniref:Uncharacterized protein n=1 Tax=Artomyces pyxidatus TaxID=48021 RepID=A0ACB8SH75_9AGAM|nr:hypothetical protein BV25DRAFT_1842784 [Artomyces pyxidatus]
MSFSDASVGTNVPIHTSANPESLASLCGSAVVAPTSEISASVARGDANLDLLTSVKLEENALVSEVEFTHLLVYRLLAQLQPFGQARLIEETAKGLTSGGFIGMKKDFEETRMAVVGSLFMAFAFIFVTGMVTGIFVIAALIFTQSFAIRFLGTHWIGGARTTNGSFIRISMIGAHVSDGERRSETVTMRTSIAPPPMSLEMTGDDREEQARGDITQHTGTEATSVIDGMSTTTVRWKKQRAKEKTMTNLPT